MLNEGNPPAASLTAAPGGAVMNAASTGAIPLRPPPSGETTLLLNAGIMPDSEESDMIISDILVAVGSVPYSSPWTISSTALTRYTDGVGVFAAVLVTTATTSSQTVRLSSYTGSDNGASQVGQYGRLNTAEYAGMLVPRLQYINYNNGGIMLGMAAGDRGVKSVQNLEWSASAGGACALLLHKPLMYVSSPGAGCLGSLSPPEMLLRCVPLAQESGGSLGFLTAFVSHGYQSADGFAITLQTVSG